MTNNSTENSYDVGKYITDIRINLNNWDDLIAKSQKLSSNMRNTSISINSFNDTLLSICKVSNTNDITGLRDIVRLLVELCYKQKSFGDKLSLIANTIQNNISTNLNNNIDNWKKSINHLKKEREHDFKKAKTEYKRSKTEVAKLKRKLDKRAENNILDSYYVQADYANQDLMNKEKFLEDLERCAMRRAIIEERKHFSGLLENIRPMLDIERSMMEEIQSIGELYGQIYQVNELNVMNSDHLPREIESEIDKFRRESTGSIYSGFTMSIEDGNIFQDSLQELNLFETKEPTENVLNTSSSTIMEMPDFPETKKVESSEVELSKQNVTEDEDEDDDEEDDVDDSRDNNNNTSAISGSSCNTVISNVNLYPNQIMPPPRYTNLKQLKLESDRKFGLLPSSVNIVNNNHMSSSMGQLEVNNNCVYDATTTQTLHPAITSAVSTCSNTLTRNNSVSHRNGQIQQINSNYPRPYSIASEPDQSNQYQYSSHYGTLPRNYKSTNQLANGSTTINTRLGVNNELIYSSSSLSTGSHYANNSTFRRTSRLVPMDIPVVGNNNNTKINNNQPQNKPLRSLSVDRRKSSSSSSATSEAISTQYPYPQPPPMYSSNNAIHGLESQFKTQLYQVIGQPQYLNSNPVNCMAAASTFSTSSSTNNSAYPHNYPNSSNGIYYQY